MIASRDRARARRHACKRVLPAIAAALLASACSQGAMLRSDAAVINAPVDRRAAIDRQSLGPVDVDLAKGHQLADSELRDMRGGFRINGLDLSIAAQITTVAVGKIALTSQFVLNDAGRWQAVASQSRILSSPANSAVRTTPLTPVSPGIGIGGPDFRAVVGNGATTQIVQEIMNNGIATMVSNRMNGLTIDQSVTLNVNVKNFSSVAATLGAAMRLTPIATDIARFR